MAIFRCHQCGYLREVPNQHIGKKVKCPVCKKITPIYDTLDLIKKLLEKYSSMRKALVRLQKTLPATEIAEPLDKTDLDIFNTTAMTAKQQYQPIVDWFKKKQIELNVDEDAVDTTGFFDEVAVKLGENYDVLKVVSDKIKRLQKKGYTNATLDLSDYSQEDAALINEFCQALYEYAFVAKCFVNKGKKKIHLTLQTAQPIVNFFNGEWLEWFAFMKLLAFCHERQMSFAGLRSFHIEFSNHDKNELDTFFLINGNIPIFVECKSGEFRPFIDKYVKLRKRLKMDKQHFFMLVVGLSDEQMQGLTRMFEISFVNEKTFLEQVSGSIVKQVSKLINGY
jgi:phage FluMu protein Com